MNQSVINGNSGLDDVKRLHDIIQKEKALKEKREFKDAQSLYTKWLDDVKYHEVTTTTTSTESYRDTSSELIRQSIALALNNRGHLKYLGVDFDGAIEDYNKALNYNPSLPSCHYNRGTIFYRMGYFENAVKDLTVAAQLEPSCDEFGIALERCKNELQSNANFS